MRYTKNDAQTAFNSLASKLNKSTDCWLLPPPGGTRPVANPGAWYLSHDIGGYRIEAIPADGHGMECPFDYTRYTAREFVRLCNSVEQFVSYQERWAKKQIMWIIPK